jgi:hypothetical protein
MPQVWKIKPNEFPVLITPAVITFVLPEISYGDQTLLNATSDNNAVPIVYKDNYGNEIIGGLLIAKNAGTVTISAFQAASEDFLQSTLSIRLTIQKKELTVTANSASRLYGASNPAFSFSYQGFVNGDTEAKITEPVAVTTANVNSNAGNYSIYFSGGSSTNYKFVYKTGTLTVQKRDLQAKPDNASRLYGYANPAFNLSYSGFVNGNTVADIALKPTVATTAAINSNVGEYTITCSGGSAVNYNLVYGTGILTITKAPLTVSVGSTSRNYGASNPVFAVTYSGFRNSDSKTSLTVQPQAVCAAVQNSNVGTYPITVSGGNATNYSFTYMPDTLMITKAPLTITAENKQRNKGEENPSFTLLYAGFKNSENQSVLDVLPTVSCVAGINSPAGIYDIVLAGGSDNNYNYTLVYGKLEVTNPSSLAEINSLEISIYPNPAKDYIFIKSEQPIEKVEIFNQSGICVLRNENVVEKLDVSSLANGLYFARIYIAGKLTTKKIIINI